MALTSNKSPTWRSFCRVSLDVSDPKYFQSYRKLKNYAFKPWFLPKGTDILCCVIASDFHVSRKVPLPLQTTCGLSHGSYVKKAWKHHLIQWVSLAESSEGTWTKFAKTCQKLSGENQLKCLILILFVLFVVSLWRGGKKLSFFSLSFHFVWEKMDVGEKKRALAGTGKRLFILFCFLQKGATLLKLVMIQLKGDSGWGREKKTNNQPLNDKFSLEQKSNRRQCRQGVSAQG